MWYFEDDRAYLEYPGLHDARLQTLFKDGDFLRLAFESEDRASSYSLEISYVKAITLLLDKNDILFDVSYTSHSKSRDIEALQLLNYLEQDQDVVLRFSFSTRGGIWVLCSEEGVGSLKIVTA